MSSAIKRKGTGVQKANRNIRNHGAA